jgi:glycosyltransferase involved in cell wall biosynthesis
MRATPRIALAHDWLVGMRGGERVLDRLARLFGPTRLYTLVNNRRFHTDAIAACDIVTSPLQRFPGAAGSWRRSYLPLMPWAVQRIRVEPCDLLISTSSAVMKSIRPPAGARHLCYCHGPARYLWDQLEAYGEGAGGGLRRIGLRAMRSRFQAWDRRTAGRVDWFLANSRHTAARIAACYGREAEVVYPPARTERFTIDLDVRREDWYLLVGALEPYKRTRLAVETARHLDVRLTVAGGGSQLRSLRSIAPEHVRFLGRVDDDELADLYRRARALIFPQEEDFGIVAVEAQAAGCPVIAFAGGGALESVTSATGEHFDAPTVASLAEAIGRFEARQSRGEFNAEACRANALRFSEAAFDEAILRQVRRLLDDPDRAQAERPFSP